MTVYPWIHQFSNNKKCSDQTRGVRFPDVNPQSLPPEVDFSMVAGDFVEVYNEAGQLELNELFTLPPKSQTKTKIIKNITVMTKNCSFDLQKVKGLCFTMFYQSLGTAWPPASLSTQLTMSLSIWRLSGRFLSLVVFGSTWVRKEIKQHHTLHTCAQ